jgi:pimeloyl-ACP methyl ester carboxylesterase
MSVALLLSGLLLAAPGPAPETVVTDDLPRRARLGAQFDAGPEGRGLTLGQVFPDSTLSAAGARPGDVLLELAGVTVNAFPDLVSAMDTVRAGDEATAVVQRDGQRLELAMTLQPKPMEQADDIRIEYGSVEVGDARLRTIVTRPEGDGPFPAMMLLQGLSCFSVDAGGQDLAYYGGITHELARRGFLTLRVEKSGMGDSTGTPCSEIDFETEGTGYVAALEQLVARDDVDRDNLFLFGHSMGGLFAPWVANRVPVKGIAAYGTGVRNWFEYMHNNMRRQTLMAGVSWADTNDTLREYTGLLTEFHVKKRPLPEILEEHPDWADFVGDPEHFAGGRHWRFFHQLGDQNAPALWASSDAWGLGIYGAADFVSNEEDHRAIADIVNRERPGQGHFVLLEGMGHGFRGADDFADARRRMLEKDVTPFDPRIIDTLTDWMNEVVGAAGT